MAQVRYKREWLVPGDGSQESFLISRIHTSHYGKDNKHHIEASLTVADCYKRIDLDFSSYDKKEAERMLSKAVRMNKHLSEFIEKLYEASKGFDV